jgi:hypothetical protein
LIVHKKLKDESLGVTWLIGILEPNTGRIKTEVLLNRSAATFKNVLRNML